MSEYEYMRSLVYWRYQAKRDEIFLHLRELHQTAVLEGDYDRAILLAARHKQEQDNNCRECEVAEDIINWLELDSELRLEKLTYPDVFELCTS
ncbi:MAG: hypothetical protein AB1861_19500 [Cyanobacteriota bacterium]